MNTQVNLRLPKSILIKAKLEAQKQGFSNLQEFIKEIIRKRLFQTQGITRNELNFVKKLYKVAEEKKLYGTEKELFSKLNEK